MVELADIFREYGAQYQAQYGARLLPSHRQALRDIMRCRTSALGGHVYTCEECEATVYHYHSCRNRHCPKCQQGKAAQWLSQQQELRLDVAYFMLTFTLPRELQRAVRSHQRLFYHLLFQTSAAAVQHLAQDPRFVGGQMGMVGVLHTWGRNLSYHPHIHYVVPGGGIAPDGSWTASRANFLLPVHALAKVFRAKFRDALRKRAPDIFATLPAQVWRQAWVVHSQPVGNGQRARIKDIRLKYLAPYIFRVAISNDRIEKLFNDKVTFRYRATDTGALKRCTLPVLAFMRRFLQHVLPKGFVKVRYYGFLAPGCRARLAALRQQLGTGVADSLSSRDFQAKEAITTEADAVASTPVLCPVCGHPMQHRAIVPTPADTPPVPRARCPP